MFNTQFREKYHRKKTFLFQFEKVEEGTPGKIRVTYKNAEGVESSDIFNTVCIAIGRKPCTSGIGLENTDVKLNEKYVVDLVVFNKVLNHD